MIKAEGLGYHSRKFKMQDISFELEDGYILTLLGKNGAGKTTLLDMLYGVLKPTKGHVYWNDVDVTGVQAIEAQTEYGHFRDEVAYVSDKVWCMDEILVEQNIALFSGLYQHWDVERFETILERLRFPKERLRSRYDELSTGQKMQVQEDGKQAVTHYQVLRQQDGQALVRLWLETGRTHQIRVHMASIGHPLMGDPLYGSGTLHQDAARLCAWKVRFLQPFTGEEIVLEHCDPMYQV